VRSRTAAPGTHAVFAAATAVAMILAAPHAPAGLAAPGQTVLTIRVSTRATATVLHLQAGFAMVLRADRRIDTVAIGDPRLVTATAVRRGVDVYDLVLQPQVETGSTNMIVWLGDLATVWRLELGPGPRTADVVYVVTSTEAAGPRSSPPSVVASPPAPSAAPPQVIPLPSRTGDRDGCATPGSAVPPPSAPADHDERLPVSPAAPVPASSCDAAGTSQLEARQTLGDVTGIFQALRVARGAVVRYRITNGSETDLVIRPGGILVRMNGRLVSYGMVRDSVDQRRPEILPRGGTETGVIEAPGPLSREVRLTLSLFPVAPDGAASPRALPLVFQVMFTGVDRLPLSAAF
jgi:hypothetical protein